jgi:hypothetical protein
MMPTHKSMSYEPEEQGDHGGPVEGCPVCLVIDQKRQVRTWARSSIPGAKRARRRKRREKRARQAEARRQWLRWYGLNR